MAFTMIWGGSSSFQIGDTPFGYYDNDPAFRLDADRVAQFVTSQLGYPVMDVELVPKQIYAAFEDAVSTYGSEIYSYKIRDYYGNVEGSTIGSVNVNTQVVTPSLSNVVRISQAYGTLAGVGGKVPYYSGSIDIIKNKSVYNLKEWALASASLATGDSIEIRKIHHYIKPASVRYGNPYGGTAIGINNMLDSFGFNDFVNSYTLLPLTLDTLKMQTIEMNDQIRRNQYSFELVDNILRLSPIPPEDTTLWFTYTKESDTNSSFASLPTGSIVSSGSGAIITNPSQVPFTPLVYSDVNHQAKKWIFQYTLANCQLTLGNVRGKYNQLPSAEGTVSLNSADLFTQGNNNIERLMTTLQNMLEATSKRTQVEMQSQINEMANNMLSYVPMPIYVG